MSTGPVEPDRTPPVDRMTDIEAIMWRLGEHDARLRSTMTLLVRFDRSVDRAALRERVEEVTRRVPVLRRRVAAGSPGPTTPRWEPDPDFSVGRHLQVVRSAGPTEPEAVAEDLIATPFRPGRPPWRAVLVPGPVEGLVLHLHHSYTDGLGGVRLLSELFDLAPAGPPRAGPAPDADEVPNVGAGGLQHDLDAELRRALRLAGRAGPWAVRSVASALRDPAPVLGTAAEAFHSLRSQLAAVTGPASPVLRGRSAAVRVAALDLPLDALQGVGRRLDATVNDAFLGGLLEGLARYHEKCAVLPPSLRLGIPISSRPPGGGGQGLHNQLYGAVLAGPLGPLDFDERTRLVHEMVVLARRQPGLGLIDDMAGLALRVPWSIALLASAVRSLDVVASNVTGPPVPMYLAGARIEEMVPLGPRSGSAINATLLSYRGRAHIGLNIDPTAVPDPGVLVDCIRGAFDDHLPG